MVLRPPVAHVQKQEERAVKVVVVAGGDAERGDAAHLAEGDLLIAADGGAQWLDEIGVTPHVVVGDLDSADPRLIERLEAAGVPIERHPVDKDASDAELAVARAVEAGADEVLILGALGGDRIDHEMANLLLLTAPRFRRHGLRLIRGSTSVRALAAGEELQLGSAPGDLVTLLPIAEDAAGVWTEGLRYQLSGETLKAGGTRGLSNEVALAPASVRVYAGSLLVIETRKELRS